MPSSALALAELGGGWGTAAFASLLDSADGRLWVACAGADPESARLGFLIARRVATLVEIDAVAVVADARRRGIGRALLGALLDAEERDGAESVQLELRASNRAAARLYAALGFVVVGRRERYYPDGEDAVLLTRLFV